MVGNLSAILVFRVLIFKIFSKLDRIFECNLSHFRVLIFKNFSNHGGLFEYNSDHFTVLNINNFLESMVDNLQGNNIQEILNNHGV